MDEPLGVHSWLALLSQPIPTAKRNSCVNGREFVLNGFMLNTSLSAGAGSTNITKYDNTSIIASGVQLFIWGCIEVA